MNHITEEYGETTTDSTAQIIKFILIFYLVVNESNNYLHHDEKLVEELPILRKIKNQLRSD